MILVIITLFSCEDQITEDWINQRVYDPEEVIIETGGTAGSNIDLSNLVVLGTSLASGVQDGALYNSGQQNSFPALLANQLKMLSDVENMQDFVQPDINSEFGYHLIFNPNILSVTFGRSLLNVTKLEPEVEPNGDLITPYQGQKSSIRNFSAPLLTSGQLVTPATGGPDTSQQANLAFNEFYHRFASAPSQDGINGSSLLNDALKSEPTFFIYEAGMNDVMLFAMNGGDDRVGITNSTDFAGVLSIVLDSLTKGQNQNTIPGAILNIPDILDFPFFTSLSYDEVILDKEGANAVNVEFEQYNKSLNDARSQGLIPEEELNKRLIEFKEGRNGILIEDEDLLSVIIPAQGETPEVTLPKYRQANNSDLTLITVGTILGQPISPDRLTSIYGTTVPIGDSLILTQTEIMSINSAITAYNSSIQQVVQAFNNQGNNIVIVEIDQIFDDALGTLSTTDKVGIVFQGVTLLPDFSPSGIFSTDGLHPNPRGHGIIANQIISAINDRWAADIPQVDVLSLRTAPFKL